MGSADTEGARVVIGAHRFVSAKVRRKSSAR